MEEEETLDPERLRRTRKEIQRAFDYEGKRTNSQTPSGTELREERTYGSVQVPSPKKARTYSRSPKEG